MRARIKETVWALWMGSALCVAAQTNYPPATAPWSTAGYTNWVYDCGFKGYGNITPGATNLACGWYDEITNANLILGPVVSILPGALQIVNVLYVAPDDLFFVVTNQVQGQHYTVYTSPDLKTWTVAFSYVATGVSDTVDWTGDGVALADQPVLFFRVFGLQTVKVVASDSNNSFFLICLSTLSIA